MKILGGHRVSGVREEASLIPNRGNFRDLARGMRKKAELYRDAVKEDIALRKDLLDAAADMELLCAFIEKHMEEA